MDDDDNDGESSSKACPYLLKTISQPKTSHVQLASAAFVLMQAARESKDPTSPCLHVSWNKDRKKWQCQERTVGYVGLDSDWRVLWRKLAEKLEVDPNSLLKPDWEQIHQSNTALLDPQSRVSEMSQSLQPVSNTSGSSLPRTPLAPCAYIKWLSDRQRWKCEHRHHGYIGTDKDWEKLLDKLAQKMKVDPKTLLKPNWERIVQDNAALLLSQSPTMGSDNSQIAQTSSSPSQPAALPAESTADVAHPAESSSSASQTASLPIVATTASASSVSQPNLPATNLPKMIPVSQCDAFLLPGLPFESMMFLPKIAVKELLEQEAIEQLENKKFAFKQGIDNETAINLLMAAMPFCKNRDLIIAKYYPEHDDLHSRHVLDTSTRSASHSALTSPGAPEAAETKQPGSACSEVPDLSVSSASQPAVTSAAIPQATETQHSGSASGEDVLTSFDDVSAWLSSTTQGGPEMERIKEALPYCTNTIKKPELVKITKIWKLPTHKGEHTYTRDELLENLKGAILSEINRNIDAKTPASESEAKLFVECKAWVLSLPEERITSEPPLKRVKRAIDALEKRNSSKLPPVWEDWQIMQRQGKKRSAAEMRKDLQILICEEVKRLKGTVSQPAQNISEDPFPGEPSKVCTDEDRVHYGIPLTPADDVVMSAASGKRSKEVGWIWHPSPDTLARISKAINKLSSLTDLNEQEIEVLHKLMKKDTAMKAMQAVKCGMPCSTCRPGVSDEPNTANECRLPRGHNGMHPIFSTRMPSTSSSSVSAS